MHALLNYYPSVPSVLYLWGQYSPAVFLFLMVLRSASEPGAFVFGRRNLSAAHCQAAVHSAWGSSDASNGSSPADQTLAMRRYKEKACRVSWGVSIGWPGDFVGSGAARAG